MMIFHYYSHDNIQLLVKMKDSESKQVLLIKKKNGMGLTTNWRSKDDQRFFYNYP